MYALPWLHYRGIPKQNRSKYRYPYRGYRFWLEFRGRRLLTFPRWGVVMTNGSLQTQNPWVCLSDPPLHPNPLLNSSALFWSHTSDCNFKEKFVDRKNVLIERNCSEFAVNEWVQENKQMLSLRIVCLFDFKNPILNNFVGLDYTSIGRNAI